MDGTPSDYAHTIAHGKGKGPNTIGTDYFDEHKIKVSPYYVDDINASINKQIDGTANTYGNFFSTSSVPPI